MPKKHAGGRPRQGEEVKAVPLNMRTSPDLREKIEEAADANGRSLTQEVEARLRSSFYLEQWLGGAHIRNLVTMLGNSIDRLEQRSGKRWTDDRETWEAANAVAMRLLLWDRPKVEANFADEAAEANAARAAREEAARALDEYRNSLGMFSKDGFTYAASRPASVTGLFGSRSSKWIDPRADWTDEQKHREAELEAALAAAAEADAKADEKLRAVFTPIVDGLKSARERGEEEAEQWLALLGPKSKPADPI